MKRRVAAIAMAVISTMLLSSLAVAAPGNTTMVSVSSSGVLGDHHSRYSSISADGRYVAFDSMASNLVAGDTNGFESDAFVHDRQTGQTTIVSVDSSGNQANYDSYLPRISADGRYVAFRSFADNLVAGDTNNMPDIFVRDRQTGQTTRVSVDSSGNQSNYYDTRAPDISADGRYVAFASTAGNLVAGDTNLVWDIFVHDRQTGQTTRVSVDSSGNQGNAASLDPSISADGRFVTFMSLASNLVVGDTDGHWDAFVHDRQTGQTTRVSVDSSGNQANNNSYWPQINADGRYVVFQTTASNLVTGDTNGHADVFVHDRQTGQTTRASVDSSGNQGNESSEGPSISADGRYVTFDSSASNLVAGDTNGRPDTFVRDRQTGLTKRVSVDSSGNEANSSAGFSGISADGRFVGFTSAASNLVPGGNPNLNVYVFVHEINWNADATPPVLTLPADMTVNATSPAGAVVTYSATATDNASTPTVACAPASGGTFPIGASTVSCTATDGSGNTASGTFHVTVQGAVEQMNDVTTLVESFNLQRGINNSLDSKLQQIQAALVDANQGNNASACNRLGSFVNEVQAQSGNALTVDQANQLIAAANQIKATLGCP